MHSLPSPGTVSHPPTSPTSATHPQVSPEPRSYLNEITEVIYIYKFKKVMSLNFTWFGCLYVCMSVPRFIYFVLPTLPRELSTNMETFSYSIVLTKRPVYATGDPSIHMRTHINAQSHPRNRIHPQSVVHPLATHESGDI